MKGFVFYEGASLIDGAPIVGIATLESENQKTGAMVQTWIMRSDIAPADAVRSGLDSSVCGDCALRGSADPTGRRDWPTGRICYVDVYRAPTAIYSAYLRGAYPRIDPLDPAARDQLIGRKLRMGAYGDPAAIDTLLWFQLIEYCDGWTGYTAQWRKAHAQGLRELCMASVQSEREHAAAVMLGWRTYAVIGSAAPVPTGRALCPTPVKQCIDCMACDGSLRQSAASMVIRGHGSGRKAFEQAFA